MKEQKIKMHFDIFHMKCTVVASGQTIYFRICIVAQCALTRQLFQVQTIKSGLLSPRRTQCSKSFSEFTFGFFMQLRFHKKTSCFLHTSCRLNIMLDECKIHGLAILVIKQIPRGYQDIFWVKTTNLIGNENC